MAFENDNFGRINAFNSVENQTLIDFASKIKMTKKKFFFKNVLIPVLLVTIGFSIGYIIRDITYSQLGNQNKTEKENQNAINNSNQTTQNGSQPTPAKNETTQPLVRKARDYTVLQTELEAYIKAQKGDYGVYVENLGGGESFGINETQIYDAASTSKVPINYMLYKKAEEGKIKLDSLMIYTKADYETGTGEILKEKIGSKYSLKRLSELSITVSDNIATNMITRALGGFKNCRKYFKEIGGTYVDEKKNTSCPRDMGVYLKLIYEFSKSNTEMGGALITNLSNTIYTDRIPKLLPSGLTIAHKIGNMTGLYHDVGIVYTKEPYIISIMSKGITSEPDAMNAISNISKKVYGYEESLN